LLAAVLEDLDAAAAGVDVTELPAVLAGDAVCKTKNERKASESSQTKKTIMQKKKKFLMQDQGTGK
jgi:hypothetical protein